MTDDYPELPDFLRRTGTGTPPHGVVSQRKNADHDKIVWPKKQIERALRLKAKAAKAQRRAKAKARKQIEAKWRG